MGISYLSPSIRFLSKEHPLPPSRESWIGLIFLLVPKTLNSPLDARAWLESHIWQPQSALVPVTLRVPGARVPEEARPVERCRYGALAGDGSNEEILLRRVRPPARRLRNKSQSCSQLAGLMSCFLCLTTKPEDKSQNAGGDT